MCLVPGVKVPKAWRKSTRKWARLKGGVWDAEPPLLGPLAQGPLAKWAPDLLDERLSLTDAEFYMPDGDESGNAAPVQKVGVADIPQSLPSLSLFLVHGRWLKALFGTDLVMVSVSPGYLGYKWIGSPGL